MGLFFLRFYLFIYLEREREEVETALLRLLPRKKKREGEREDVWGAVGT